MLHLILNHSLFIDAFIIGEGEETINNFLDVYNDPSNENLSRKELLFKLAQVPGVYVPCFYDHIYDENNKLSAIKTNDTVPQKVSRQWIRDLDAYDGKTVITTENTEFNLFLIETSQAVVVIVVFAWQDIALENLAIAV